MAWKAAGVMSLPLADRDRDWNSDEAEARIFRWAGWEDDADPQRARRAFFAYDDEAPTNKTAYKLPYADVINGELRAVPRAIFAVAQVLEGARGGVDLPDEVQREVRHKVEAYYEAMGEAVPW